MTANRDSVRNRRNTGRNAQDGVSPDSECMLIGDIGGTNARFALAKSDTVGFTRAHMFPCADFPSADMAIEHYLQIVGRPKPGIICIAAAGPLIDGNISLTNNSWSLDVDRLVASFGGATVRLLNDFDATAYTVPQLNKKDCLSIGSLPPSDLSKIDFTIGVVGPGTGFGTAGLCRRGDRIFSVGGEGGYVGFAPETEEQIRLLSHLRDTHGRVSDEHLLSGKGIVNLYNALAGIRGESITACSPEEVFSRASAGTDPRATEAVQLFFQVLGQVAGNLALLLGAIEGIYIGGGIVPRYPALLLASQFREGFENKGRHRSLMEKFRHI